MGFITVMAGAVRAGLDLLNRDADDTIVALSHDIGRLESEVDMLRDKLAEQRERIERQRVDVSAVLARYGARHGEDLEAFVARLADAAALGQTKAAELQRLRAEKAAARERIEEWEQAAAKAEPQQQVCRTCRACKDGDGRALPGAQALCDAIHAETGSVVQSSVYQLDARPKACPGWRPR